MDVVSAINVKCSRGIYSEDEILPTLLNNIARGLRLLIFIVKADDCRRWFPWKRAICFPTLLVPR